MLPCLKFIQSIAWRQKKWNKLVQKTLEIKSWMVNRIRDSRAKDYQNEFRKMIYDNDQEMEEVIGRLEDNVFIRQQEEEYEELVERIGRRG